MKLGFPGMLLLQVLKILGEGLNLGHCQCLCERIGTWNMDEEF